ncbi:hypothetical protein [Geodermatophilus sp. URMC 63]
MDTGHVHVPRLLTDDAMAELAPSTVRCGSAGRSGPAARSCSRASPARPPSSAR